MGRVQRTLGLKVFGDNNGTQRQGPAWLSYFAFLYRAGLYVQHERADRVALQFIFMPIIRHELIEFVESHNAHPTRRQPKRVYHVSGVPNELFRDPQRQCGFPVDIPVWEEWEAGFGKLMLHRLAFPRIL